MQNELFTSRAGGAWWHGRVFCLWFLNVVAGANSFKEGHKYPAVFRPEEEMFKVMPIGIVATFIAILVVAIIFAMIHPGGSDPTEGARLGVLIGIFAVCAVLHNYVNLNIGLKLALGQAVAYFIQWTIGIVIGLIYKPLATPERFPSSRGFPDGFSKLCARRDLIPIPRRGPFIIGRITC